MLAEIEGLLVLQDRDRRLLDLKGQLDRLPAEESRAKTKLGGDQAAVETARDALRRLEVEIKKVELDVETRRTTITRLKQQQFETRKNDEYQALGHEITRYEKEVDTLETRELELMEEADGLRARLSDAESALATTRKLVDEDLAAIAQRGKRLEEERSSVGEERSRLASAVEGSLLSLYDRLLAKKNGLAVAPVKGGQCGGCHVRLVPATLIKAQGGNEIVQCENCGRILYPGE